MSNIILDGIMGLTVADALGVPVEFESREDLLRNPVTGMESFGTYNQPEGTWSDDTSMTLCLVESLIDGLNYKDIMNNFVKWLDKGEYTPHGEVFDIGNTTRESIVRYKKGNSPLESGGDGEYDNGNGVLMRILPILFYLQSRYGSDIDREEKAFEVIHGVSSLTHNHKRNLIACGIYISVASNLIGGISLEVGVNLGIYKAMEYYRKKEEFITELEHFARLENKDFKNLPAEEIKSGGYVVDTLEAALWCLLNTSDYKSCVLKAVNLGRDTDTVGAVVGGLAGIVYGYEDIPSEWIQSIVRKEYIEELCSNLNKSLTERSIKKLLKYIGYFENVTEKSLYSCSVEQYEQDEKDGVGYPIYDNNFLKFIDEFYKSNLMSYDYLEIIENEIGNVKEIDSYIRTADIKLLRAILTGYIRQERFNEGLWATAAKDKVFLKILNRFEEII